NPLLLLVLICQLVSATMVGVLAGHLFGAAGVFVATVGEVVVIFVIFEAIANGVIGLFGGSDKSQQMTETDILNMADVAHEDDAIESEERNFIHSVIEFGDTIVREVMVPRIDMVDIAASVTIRNALDLAIESGRSRIPVYGESVDDVVGLVNLRHLAALVSDGHGDDLVGGHMGQVQF